MQRLIASIAMAATMAFPVTAVCEEASSQITQPVWTTQPPTASLPARFQREEYRTNVRLICTVSEDMLTGCQPTEPTPDAFLQSALRAAGIARIGRHDAQGAPTNGRQVSFLIGFPIPVMLDPPTQPANLISRAVWLERPSPDDIAAAFPPQAREQGITGNVFLECTVGNHGFLQSCRSIGTSGGGFHSEFAAAALTLTALFKIDTNDADGQPTAGRIVRVPVAFRPQ